MTKPIGIQNLKCFTFHDSTYELALFKENPQNSRCIFFPSKLTFNDGVVKFDICVMGDYLFFPMQIVQLGCKVPCF
jgi:hypothetical protein